LYIRPSRFRYRVVGLLLVHHDSSLWRSRYGCENGQLAALDLKEQPAQE
jgi:hypothetical protein